MQENKPQNFTPNKGAIIVFGKRPNIIFTYNKLFIYNKTMYI